MLICFSITWSCVWLLWVPYAKIMAKIISMIPTLRLKNVLHSKMLNVTVEVSTSLCQHVSPWCSLSQRVILVTGPLRSSHSVAFLTLMTWEWKCQRGTVWNASQVWWWWLTSGQLPGGYNLHLSQSRKIIKEDLNFPHWCLVFLHPEGIVS